MMDSNHQSIGFEPTPSTSCSNGTYFSLSIETATIVANKITAIPISIILMPGLLNVSNKNSIFVINVPKEGFEPSKNYVLSVARLPISPPGHNKKKQIIDQFSWLYISPENEERASSIVISLSLIRIRLSLTVHFAITSSRHFHFYSTSALIGRMLKLLSQY